MAVLLIVEDDTATNEAICEYMRSAGHITLSALDGEQGLQIAREKSVDLVLLDIMLPKRTGLEVLKELRQTSNIPILMLTALEDEPTQAASFDEQADDYITKPFELAELTARVESVLRRYHKGQNKIKLAGLDIDMESRTVKRDGTEIELTMKELELLQLFLRNRNIALFRDRIYEEVWGGEYDPESRTVDVHIQRLKKKLDLEGVIVSVRKIGYRLEADKE